MVLSEAVAECALVGWTLRKEGDEYVIFPSNTSPQDRRSYFTMDMEDAVSTARREVP